MTNEQLATKIFVFELTKYYVKSKKAEYSVDSFTSVWPKNLENIESYIKSMNRDQGHSKNISALTKIDHDRVIVQLNKFWEDLPHKFDKICQKVTKLGGLKTEKVENSKDLKIEEVENSKDLETNLKKRETLNKLFAEDMYKKGIQQSTSKANTEDRLLTIIAAIINTDPDDTDPDDEDCLNISKNKKEEEFFKVKIFGISRKIILTREFFESDTHTFVNFFECIMPQALGKQLEEYEKKELFTHLPFAY